MNMPFIGLVLLILPFPAYAYVDPNAGGILFQILFPVLVAIAAVWAVFKEKLRTLLGRRAKDPEATDEKPE